MLVRAQRCQSHYFSATPRIYYDYEKTSALVGNSVARPTCGSDVIFKDFEVTATQPFDDNTTDQRTCKLRTIRTPYLHSSLNILFPGLDLEIIKAFKNLSGSISSEEFLLTLKTKILLQAEAFKVWAFTNSSFTL